jgi:hypothetical protein
MKIIWKVTLRSYETKNFPVTKISLVDRRDLGMFFSYEHNIAQLSHLAGKLSVVSATFLFLTCILKFFNFSRFARHTSVSSQPETLPGKRDNVSPYEQNKIIWLVEMFSCYTSSLKF